MGCHLYQAGEIPSGTFRDEDFRAHPEEIIQQRPHLDLAKVYAALAYYYSNKELIDLEITNYYQDFARLEASYANQ